MMDERFWSLLPWAIMVELAMGPVQTCVIWPWAKRRLPDEEATFVIASSAPLCIVPPLTLLALLLGDAPTTIWEASWWWTIAFLPSFLSGAISYLIRQGTIRQNEQIAKEIAGRAED